ncbi:vWA domain-containing protein [Virgibacillus ndiopensis]|uniref:vWA domain-containing protein n=1 Tax=Virgibacillus ndiopensis TaxID=2004408 RepID=UPI00159BCDDD|nr:VWA domain-containing protein [Virgibacillus ndiopensis]
MFRRVFVSVFMVLLLFITACSDDETTEAKNEKDVKQPVKKEQTITEELTSISLALTRGDLKGQQGGTLVTGTSLEEDLADEETEIDPATKDKLITELKKITEETQNPKDLQKVLVQLLGSNHYKEIIEKAENFEPDFEEPFLPDPEKSKEEVENEPKKGKAIILLDASSSMLLKVDNQLKMDIAKKAVKRFGEAIGQENDVSLVVYGHKGSESDADKALSCTGIEEVYPMGSYKKEAFEKSLTTFKSKGWTPLAGAIKKASEMSKNYDENITVYIVSDGVETCDGDPVKEAKSFVKDNEERSVNIIGFHVDQDAENQLKKVSEAGNGDYFAANSADDLKTTIEKEWLPSYIDLAWAFTKAPDAWERLDEYDRFDVELEAIKDIIKKEKERFDQAVNIIRDEEMIESAANDELRELVSERYSKMIDEMGRFRSFKIDEIDKRSEEIHKRVEKWTERMRQRKEERGDMF